MTLAESKAKNFTFIKCGVKTYKFNRFLFSQSTPDVQGNVGKAEKTSKEECCPSTAKIPENDTCQSAESTTKLKPKGKFGKLIANVPFRRNTSRQKKQPKKVRKFTDYLCH